MLKKFFLLLPIVFCCCQRPSQTISPIQGMIIEEDSIEYTKKNTLNQPVVIQEEKLQCIPMDSIWKYFDDALTTSGRCNRPPFYNYGMNKKLYYGFYCLIDKIPPKGQCIEIADVTVSYTPNKKWMSHDTSQRICELHVRDKFFRPKFASFHIGDKKSQITEKFIKEIDNIHYYHKDNALYCVELIQDTIRQYMILYSCIDFEWDTLHQYVYKHFKPYDRYY